jgi:outer membrane biosynthesis protein TonB
MKYRLTLLFMFLLFVFSVALAQENANYLASRIPWSQVPGSYLIAWSGMQTPQPVPQPSPRPMPPTPDPQPETEPSKHPAPAPSQPSEPGQAESSQAQIQTPEPAAQTFTGTISKEGDSYVLKVSDTSSYKLDDQDKAKQYEGQRVRVIGSLDTSSNLIHVQKIEPVS